MPTRNEMMMIIRAIHHADPPVWLEPGEYIEFHDSQLTIGIGDEWRFTSSLYDSNKSLIKSVVSDIPAQVLQANSGLKNVVLKHMRTALQDMYEMLRPDRELSPVRAQILQLALSAWSDDSFLPVLGDAIIEADWCDERVISWLWESEAPDASPTLREMHFLLASDCKEEGAGDGPWRRMQREWAKSVACHLLFGEWSKSWEMVRRCLRSDWWRPGEYEEEDLFGEWRTTTSSDSD